MPNHFRRLAICVLLTALAGCNSSGCNPFAPSPEKQAVRMIEKLGGQVVRDDKNPARPIILVKFPDNHLTDEALRSLREKGFLHLLGQAQDGRKQPATLADIKSLNLNGAKVTDAGLKELADLTGLQTLNLSGCREVTDAGLKELAGLAALQSLDLSLTQVTDAGLKELAGLKGLQTLNLYCCLRACARTP